MKLKLILLLLSLILVGGCASAISHTDLNPLKSERIIWSAAAWQDVRSSEKAFNAGAIEGNPLIPGKRPTTAELSLFKVGSYNLTALFEGWVASMQPDGKAPGWFKKLLWLVGAALQEIVALHNYSLVR